MKVGAIAAGVGVVAVGAYLYYDQTSESNVKDRELNEIRKLAPDVDPIACFPKGPWAKLFSAAIKVDARPANSFASENEKKGTVKSQCIRGSNGPTVTKLAKLLGEEGIPFWEKVLEGCPVAKDDYPVPACYAMDGLATVGGPKIVPILEKYATNRTINKNLYLGALFRLLAVNWKTVPQLAELVGPETSWEAGELMLEPIRASKDLAIKAATKTALEKSYEQQKDETVKGHIKAAILEIENPGRCVAEDEGTGSDGICRYFCRDQNLRLRFPKVGKTCPLVREVGAEQQAAIEAEKAAAAAIK